MEFRKYIHIEKFGNDEVDGINIGENYIFPKIDGSNGVIWFNEGLRAGSRNREVSLDNDNQGFFAYILGKENYCRMCEDHPDLYFYGEWLVPHSLKTYRSDAWSRFYIFDVIAKDSDTFMSFKEYEPILKEYKVDYIHPIAIVKNGSYDNFTHELSNNKFLIKDGDGIGEGIVLKNYNYKNKYGRQVWAKIVSTHFKEKHIAEMGAPIKEFKMVESIIVDRVIDDHFVGKTYSKIINENNGWRSKYIPHLLNRCFHDLVKEEIWDEIKKLKDPTIDFKKLQSLCVAKIKSIKPDIF